MCAWLCCLFSWSCATSPTIQPQINSLVVAGRDDYALKILDQNPQSYGSHNRLLYLLDYGLVLHLTGHYERSIPVLEDAKRVYDQLYTVSLFNASSTWLINDNLAPYRGEDFERVMLNVFQAMNFVALGDIEGALVEMRDMDSKLRLINSQYPPGQENTYKEDGFARMFEGLLYEATGSRAGFNDALISYRKAAQIYADDFEPNYGVPAPALLHENLAATLKYLNPAEYRRTRSAFDYVRFKTVPQKKMKGEVILIHYYGLSPIKHEIGLPIPVPGGYVARLAFPHYDDRPTPGPLGEFRAVNAQNKEVSVPLEVGQDIGAIAMESLHNRRYRVVLKAVVRSGMKLAAAKYYERQVRDEHGENAVRWYRYFMSLYNVATEQADLRSWQTMPDQIQIARVLLEPGRYMFYYNDTLINEVVLDAGEKQFLIHRTNR